jgi:hypothetical protein
MVLASLFADSARADSWAAPQVTEVFSASRDHFVRITPGKSLGDTIGFADSAGGHRGKQRCRNSNATDAWHSGNAMIDR